MSLEMVEKVQSNSGQTIFIQNQEEFKALLKSLAESDSYISGTDRPSYLDFTFWRCCNDDLRNLNDNEI